jgi:hypothetical protein
MGSADKQTWFRMVQVYGLIWQADMVPVHESHYDIQGVAAN